jgi:hypothetical protein
MRLSDLHHSLAAQLRLKIKVGIGERDEHNEARCQTVLTDGRKLRWRQAKKKLAWSSLTDEKVKGTATRE